MGTTNLKGIKAAGRYKILCLLDAVRHSQAGSMIYRQVERMLEDAASRQQAVEHAYVTLINQLLDAYIAQLREASPLQVQARLLQTRLKPPLTLSDLETLRDDVDLYASQISALPELDSGPFQDAVEPLLKSFSIIEGGGEEPRPKATPETLAPKPRVEDAFAQPSAAEEPPPQELNSASPDEPEWPLASTESPVQETAAQEQASPAIPATDTIVAGIMQEQQPDTDNPETETQVDTAYPSHLDSKHRDIQKLQAMLAQQVLGTIAQNEEFGVLLEVVLGELRQASDGRELEALRGTLIRQIETLTKAQHELAEKLDSIHHYLQLIESDSRQLNDELTRVRLLSLTDELTGLPNRRAFLRRIEDEVARVQRYGSPLSLALIDLDHFKQVNDKYGHAGGDEVLQIYSKNILSIFRHHDLVARYGGEEFAVLLPNTDSGGSLRALTKAKNRALETRWQAGGELLPIPTFSSGVSFYKPGETASAFIERADKALYQAKRLGRNRVELDATYQNGSESAVTKDTARKKPGES